MAKNLYRITGRARSGVIFRENDALNIDYIKSGVSAKISLHTRYLTDRFEIPVPGEVGVEIEVLCESLDEAIEYINAARELAAYVALAANAAIEPLQPELAYDVTPDKSEREFFQKFQEGDAINLSSRKIPIEAAQEVIASIANHADKNRIGRAIAQYNQALQQWIMGNELLVLSHLWMGIEAISVAALRKYLVDRSIHKEDLAKEWGFVSGKGHMKIDEYVSIGSRAMLVCRGDEFHCNIAQNISNAFEHSSENPGDLIPKARGALIPIMTYLRTAILDVIGVSELQRAVMVSEPYSRPRGLGGPEHYIRANIVGHSNVLSQGDCRHPCFDWEHRIKGVHYDSEKIVYNWKQEQKLVAKIGDKLQFTDIRHEAYDAGQMDHKSAGEWEID